MENIFEKKINKHEWISVNAIGFALWVLWPEKGTHSGHAAFRREKQNKGKKPR